MDAAEANGKAMKIGAGVGLVGGLLSLALGGASTCIPFCGCFAGLANLGMPALFGLVGGAGAAATAEWDGVGAEDRTGFGVAIGLRGGAAAAAIVTLAYVFVALLSPIVGIVLNVVFYSGGDFNTLMSVLAASLVATLFSIAMNVVFAFMSLVGGVCAGAASGAVVAMTKA